MTKKELESALKQAISIIEDLLPDVPGMDEEWEEETYEFIQNIKDGLESTEDDDDDDDEPDMTDLPTQGD